MFPFIIKPTDFIAGSSNVIVDFHIALVHENKIVIDVINDGMYLTLASILPENVIKTDRIVQDYVIQGDRDALVSGHTKVANVVYE